MSKKVSLTEIMGKGDGSKLGLDNLHTFLGDAMPELPKNAVGRIRLIRALKGRFGPNFRALPGVADVVKEFDDSIAHEHKVHQLSQIKLRK